MMRRELFNGCEVSHIIVPQMLSVCRSENNRLPHRGATLVRISRRELFNGCEVFHMTPAQAAYLCPGGTHTAYLYCNLLRGPLDGRPARWTELVHCVGFVRYTDTTSGCVRSGRERFASVWLCSVNAAHVC